MGSITLKEENGGDLYNFTFGYPRVTFRYVIFPDIVLLFIQLIKALKEIISIKTP